MITADLSPLQQLQVDRLLQEPPMAPTFRAWNERVRPAMHWDWPHLVALQDTLDRLAAGEIRRVILELPVRHGKTETGTVSWPANLLDFDPRTRIIVAGYNATLAMKFSRKIRKVAVAAGIALSEERNAAEDWETTAGGGVRAVGVGGGVTGQGGDVIIIDDPVKSREEAESLTYRDKVWDWYTSDLYTRLEPGGKMLITMSRWHEDDLVGRILASEDGPQWHVLRLPALAEANDPLGRTPGQALCPERYDEAALAAIRVAVGEYGFASLYQQTPRPRTGGRFPKELAPIVPAAPAVVDARVRYWDFAATEAGGDYTVGVKMSRVGGLYYVEHVERGQWGSGRRDAVIRQTAALDGVQVPQHREQEPGSSGKDAARAFVTMLGGFTASAAPVSGDKETRADPFASQWQAGNVRIVQGAWNAAYFDELAGFPSATHDDQVDGSSGAFGILTANDTAILDFYRQEAAALRARRTPTETR